MWPEKIQNEINEINQIINNYRYLSMTRKELVELQTSIDHLLKNIEHYENETIIDLAHEYQQVKDNLAIAQTNQIPSTSAETTDEKLRVEAIKQLETTSEIAKAEALFDTETEVTKLKILQSKIGDKITALDIALVYSEEQKYDAYEHGLHSINEGIVRNSELEQLLISGQLTASELVLSPFYDESTEWLNDSLLLNAIKENNLEAVKMLCEAGAELEMSQELINEHEVDLPLVSAIEIQNSEMIDYLLTKNLDVNLIGFGGDSALVAAISTNNFPLFQRLINDYQANFNDIENQAQTLELIVESCNFEAFDFVVAHFDNLDLNRVNSDGIPILTNVLLEEGFKNDQDQTKQIMMIEKLVEHGYNINILDNEDKTILDYTFDSDYEGLAQYTETFLKFGAKTSNNLNAEKEAILLADNDEDNLAQKTIYEAKNVQPSTVSTLHDSEIDNSWNQPSTSKGTATSTKIISNIEVSASTSTDTEVLPPKLEKPKLTITLKKSIRDLNQLRISGKGNGKQPVVEPQFLETKPEASTSNTEAKKRKETTDDVEQAQANKKSRYSDSAFM